MTFKFCLKHYEVSKGGPITKGLQKVESEGELTLLK